MRASRQLGGVSNDPVRSYASKISMISSADSSPVKAAAWIAIRMRNANTRGLWRSHESRGAAAMWARLIWLAHVRSSLC